MNILFRADSSSTIGTGHIMRDLVLSQQYAKKGHNITFATQELDGNINQKIVESGYGLMVLKSDSQDELLSVIKEFNVDLLVVDNYDIDYEFEKYIKDNSAVKILSFDDTYEKHYCDILLNHNISADKKRYKGLVPDKCELRCGSKYTLLRDEFLEEFPKKTASNHITVFLALGGVDSRELNIPILKILDNYNEIKVNVITTTSNKNLNHLKEFISDKKNIKLHINTSEIAKLMYMSDFAIVTPSVTVNEAHYMKLPFIAIKTEDNQNDIYQFLKKNNYLVLDKFETKPFIKTLDTMLNILKVQLVNFTCLSIKEKKMILEWRNSESIKKWMYNRDQISLNDHLSYIDSLSNKEDRKYFLIKNERNNYGVVDLTNIIKNDSAELGIYVKPGLKGHGSLLMYKIIDYAFNTLKLSLLSANVYLDNINAINLYEKFNFIVVGTTKDNNGELYYMELRNENR